MRNGKKIWGKKMRIRRDGNWEFGDAPVVCHDDCPAVHFFAPDYFAISRMATTETQKIFAAREEKDC
jgi:hypothetical protein